MSLFNKIRLKRPKRSTFDLSHDTKFTMPFGWLVPVWWDYFEPNTTFKASSEIMARFAPMMAPIMHRVNIYTYWFKIPLRLCSGLTEERFEKFITGGEDGLADIYYPKFKISAADSTHRGYYLLDYLGVPNNWQQNPYDESTGHDIVFDAAPFLAYNFIWNEYFRDQNTMSEVHISLPYSETPIPVISSTSYEDIISMKSRCWEKDYFTSALPHSQRGATAVPVPFTVASELAMDGTTPSYLWPAAGSGESFENRAQNMVANTPVTGTLKHKIQGSASNVLTDAQVDITNHTKIRNSVSGNILDLRRAFALQRWMERNAVGGARYIEQINAHFGVWADDYRLQRPQYLGGSRTPIAISEVLQTSESSSSSAQGTMSGRGFTMDKNGFVHAFNKEHCIIMCLVTCVPKPAYFQGLQRKMYIRDRFDFVTPELAHIGEQEVRKSELLYLGDGQNEDTFGYQSRYCQYKYAPNEVHGYFKDQLLVWHLARKFENTPSLNRNFLLCDADRDSLNRIFAVEDISSIYHDVGHPIWCQMAFNIKVKRPLPYYCTPL